MTANRKHLQIVTAHVRSPIAVVKVTVTVRPSLYGWAVNVSLLRRLFRTRNRHSSFSPHHCLGAVFSHFHSLLSTQSWQTNPCYFLWAHPRLLHISRCTRADGESGDNNGGEGTEDDSADAPAPSLKLLVVLDTIGTARSDPTIFNPIPRHRWIAVRSANSLFAFDVRTDSELHMLRGHRRAPRVRFVLFKHCHWKLVNTAQTYITIENNRRLHPSVDVFSSGQTARSVTASLGFFAAGSLTLTPTSTMSC